MPTLTLIDVLGIQHFVFATNRLRHAVAGSALVERLPQWVDETCGAAAVVFASGGNAALRFADGAQARAAMTRLSRRVHDEAPGLEFSAVHHDYPAGSLARAVLEAQVELQQEKLHRRPNAPLLGLGVTAACADTHLPASDLARESPSAAARPVTTAVLRRESLLADIRNLWNRYLPEDRDDFSRGDGPRCSLRFPTEVDHLGRTRDDRSLLAVVHIDGNGIGSKIENWLDDQARARTPDEDLCRRYQQLSASLTDLGCAALGAVVRRVCDAIHDDPANPREHPYSLFSARRGFGFPLRSDRNQLNLPLRPLILGGDDLTFICDGRVALDLAAVALRTYQHASPEPLGPVRACAGIALTPTHAPIIRAYDMAEELCSGAKRFLRDERQPTACALDWHVGFTSPTESLDELRERQYRQAHLRLTRRPYYLEGVEGGESQRDWTWLAGVVDGFAAFLWLERRSKVKQLPDLARRGQDAVRRALAAWRISAPGLALPGGIPENGYHGDDTSLLDAVELLDLHLPLDSGA